jgi:protein-disulfide isomerase
MTTHSGQPSQLKERLDLSATIVMTAVALVVGGLAVWDRVHPQAGAPATVQLPLPIEPVSIENAQTRGDQTARVALIGFSDFECPYCARTAQDVLPTIQQQYLDTGKVLFVWRHDPLPSHKNAAKAAEAAECAGRQGKFWEFHDWAFAHQTELDQANLRLGAKTLGLDDQPFVTCLAGQATAKVEADVKAATALSVSGTPTWFVGVIDSNKKVKVTARLVGAQPLGEFQGALDKAIATGNARGN